MLSSSPDRVRLAPSPTGYLHIGNLRTALYNWFQARKTGGTFIVRVEDTDRTRLVDDATMSLLRTLETCGLTSDEGVMLDASGALVQVGEYGPYIQSERRERHLQYAYDLIEKDHAYYCFCTEAELTEMRETQVLNKQPVMYDRRCRAIPKEKAENRAAVGDACVIRLKMPLEGSCVFHDEVRGRIEVPWAQVDDQVLIKTDGYPTYHLAATCDDHDMHITKVIRGEEWISSTPKHLYIAEVMGWAPPTYAHVPLLLNPDRSKLSKRQGDVAVEDYLAKGYLPEALVNFVALLGWNPTSDREIFSKEELAPLFELSKVNPSGAVLNKEKLDWLNGHYLKIMAEERYLALAEPMLASVTADTEAQTRIALLFRDRVSRVQELPSLVAPWLVRPVPSAELLVWKTQTPSEARERLVAVRSVLAETAEELFTDMPALETQVKAWIVEQKWGNGEVLWPLRTALSGAKQSPSPFELLYLVGKQEGLARIDEALACLA